MYQIKNILHNKKGRPYTMARNGLRDRMKAVKAAVRAQYGSKSEGVCGSEGDKCVMSQCL